MSRLTARFPSFGDAYDALKLRELVRHLESLFARINVDETRGAYPVTADATLGATDDVVLVDTSGGDVTITLPEISDAMVRLKQEFEVVKTEAANTLYVVPSGTDTTVGDTSVTVTIQWTALRFRAATGNWVLI